MGFGSLWGLGQSERFRKQLGINILLLFQESFCFQTLLPLGTWWEEWRLVSRKEKIRTEDFSGGNLDASIQGFARRIQTSTHQRITFNLNPRTDERLHEKLKKPYSLEQGIKLKRQEVKTKQGGLFSAYIIIIQET
jgi:hypothetical protein